MARIAGCGPASSACHLAPVWRLRPTRRADERAFQRPADEQKGAVDGNVEAWGRSPDNLADGWYGLRKGYRGRFGMYLPPLLEALGLAELEHNPRNNRVRAI